MTKNVVIVGAGGLAREVAWLIERHVSRGSVSLLGLAEKPGGRYLDADLNGYPCHELEYYRRTCNELSAVVAIGSSRRREQVFQQLSDLGIAHFTCIDPDTPIAESVSIGEGSVVCRGVCLTVNAVIGKGVQINPGCTIAHDVVIDDFVTIGPGANIAGNVMIRRGAFIGIGANIVNGTPDRKLVIGEYATVGAGACVIRDVPPQVTVVGVPAVEISAGKNRGFG